MSWRLKIRHTTGYASPTFVIDGPGGAGKIPLLPDAVVGRDGDSLLLRNYAGEICAYPDPLGARAATAGAEDDARGGR